MARIPVPARMFALVLVRHAGRYLLVREAKHGNTWYLPAGGVEPGEDVSSAAVRETIEEAGVVPRIRGIVRIEHDWHEQRPGTLPATRLRFVFLAEPANTDMITPKQLADQHSLEARWVRPSEIAHLDLRHPEVGWLVDEVERGAIVLPISAYVGAPLPRLASGSRVPEEVD